MMRKMAASYQWYLTVLVSSHCTLTVTNLQLKKKRPVLCKNALDETVKIINVIKSGPLSTCLLKYSIRQKNKYAKYYK